MKKTKKIALLVAVLMMMVVCFTFWVSANDEFEAAIPVVLGEDISITFEVVENHYAYYQEKWLTFTPVATGYYKFSLDNPYYYFLEDDTYVRLYDSYESAEYGEYMVYEDLEDDVKCISFSANLNKNQKYYICINVSSGLDFDIPHTMTFSVNEGVKTPPSAEIINNGEIVNVYLDEEKWEHTIKFVPTKTDFYKFSADCLGIESVELNLLNRTGESITSEFFNKYTNECSVISKLKANNTYYLEVSYWGSISDFIDVSIKAEVHEHLFNEEDVYISKASEYEDGYIENICIECNEMIETVIPKVKISVSESGFTYNQKTQKPIITVTDSTGKVFVEGADYIASYPESSIDVNDYSIFVTMDNEYYEVDTEIFYIIEEKSIEDLTVKLSDTKIHCGEKPTISISGLKINKDFECDIWYWGVGEQEVTVYGVGNYTGEQTVKFTVYPANVTGLKVSKTTSSSITLSWKEDENYSVQYYQIYDVKNKKIIATVDYYDTSYTIKKLKAGTVYSYKVRSYTKENGKKYYGDWVEITGITKPVAASLASLKSSKAKTFTAKWDKQTSATGYQIQYSTSSSFSGAKTVKIAKNSSTSKTVSSLKSGKKYYVKIRTYKTVKVNGKSKTVYSSWSKAKSVKIK